MWRLHLKRMRPKLGKTWGIEKAVQMAFLAFRGGKKKKRIKEVK